MLYPCLRKCSAGWGMYCDEQIISLHLHSVEKELCCASLIKAVSRGGAALVGVSVSEKGKKTAGISLASC